MKDFQRIALIFIILTVVNCNAFSQTPGISWQRCYGGRGNEAINNLNVEAGIYGVIKEKSFVRAVDGGFFIAGQTNSSGEDIPVHDKPGAIAILRVNEQKNIVWSKVVGGVGGNNDLFYDDFGSIQQTADKGCIVMGSTTSSTGQAVGNHGGYDIMIVKLNRAGQVEWNKCYGGPGNERGYHIKPTAEGGYIFVGSTSSTTGNVSGNNGGLDTWLVKIDKLGNIEWQKCYGGSGDDEGYYVENTTDGNYVFAASKSICSGSVLTKVDISGNVIWEKCVQNLNFTGMTYTKDGGWLMVGTTRNYPLFGRAIKLDTTGNLEWQKTFGGTSNNIFNDVKQTVDGNYIISGSTRSNDGDVTGNHGSSDAWVVKIDTAGGLLWQKCFGGSLEEAAINIFETKENEFTFLGLAASVNGDVVGKHPDGFCCQPTVDWWMVQLSAVSTVKGIVYNDANRNGVKDIDEKLASNILVKSFKNNYSRSSVSTTGIFSIDVDTGTFKTTVIPSNDYYTVAPIVKNTSFTSFNTVDSFSFALQPIAGKRDLFINLFPATVARPGFPVVYNLIYKNQGTDTVPNGVVQLIKNNKLTLISTTPPFASITGDTIRWNYTAFKPQDSAGITLNFIVPAAPSVNIGDDLISVASITPVAGELTLDDNTFRLVHTVVGSYDPNDKTEAHGGSISKEQVESGEWLQYTIRFQNTGTDTAFTVTIKDTLSYKVDWNTLQMISSSHLYNLSIKDGDKCVWHFSNIQLVDSNRNEPKSHGYLVYRIKGNKIVKVADTINNTAAIYFDYNPPVLTNVSRTHITGGVLPVKLLIFTAKEKEQNNVLEWSTSKEVNVSGFDIERSNDGRNFMEIGHVKAGMSIYNFLDKKPPTGINYYRLTMVGRDGTFEYSPIRIVNNKRNYFVSIYPNPTKDKLQVQFDSKKRVQVKLQVIAQDGKRLILKTITIIEGATLQPIDLKALRKGTYVLSVTSQDNEQSTMMFEKL